MPRKTSWKGDISNEVREGTFLKSYDTAALNHLSNQLILC